MKRVWNFLYGIAGLVLLGALALGVVAAFQALSSRGQALGSLAEATSPPQAYPPPQVTIPIPTPLPNIEPPTPTFPPVLTPLPTPIVTVVPLAEPPYVSFTEGDLPYIVIVQEEKTIRYISVDGGAKNGIRSGTVAIPLPHAGREANIWPDSWANVSPDRNQLAVVLQPTEAMRFDIYLLDVRTQKAELLLKNAVEPAWSPDGKKIVYRDTETFGLKMFETDTKALRELYQADHQNQEEWVSSFSWSPDSQKVAFTTRFGEYEPGGLWVADISGSEKSKIVVSKEFQVAAPAWSPKGDRIAFISTQGEHHTQEKPASIWIVDVATGAKTQLTYDMTTVGGSPSWSPDGQWLVFGATNLLEGGNLPYDIWLVASDGSSLKRLTQDEASDLRPFWTSDGARIIFLKKGSGILELDVNTGSQSQLYPQDNEYFLVR